MSELRALRNTERPMQRLGYLKRVVQRATSLSTSSLDNLAYDLIETITRKFYGLLTIDRATYIKRLRTDRTLKTQANAWLKARTETQVNDGPGTETPQVAMELQDLYLADRTLPSQVGKLVKANGDLYPILAVNLGLIRAGTYSANTRALSLLYLTPPFELQAFLEYKPEDNPLHISLSQVLLLLYAFLENDGEVIAPLWAKLATDFPESFTDGDAGNCLPDIFQSVVTRHRNRILSADMRDRLINLERWIQSIRREREAQKSGSGSRDHASRVRVEPYVDMKLLIKPDPFKHEYAFSSAGLTWADALKGVETSEAVEELLRKRFFSISAKAGEIEAHAITDPESIIPHLYRAWEVIRSPGGYAPIEELGLLAGIETLLKHKVIIELDVAQEAIIAYQKANPYQVRFTVNRLGVLAHARFLEAPLHSLPVENG